MVPTESEGIGMEGELGENGDAYGLYAVGEGWYRLYDVVLLSF